MYFHSLISFFPQSSDDGGVEKGCSGAAACDLMIGKTQGGVSQIADTLKTACSQDQE